MGGFENLPQATPIGEALAPLTPEETKFIDQDDWDDATAMGIVLADIDLGIGYEQAKNMITTMELADDFIRGYVRIRPWPNSDKPRSALSMPVVLEAIEKFIRKLHLALFGSGKDPWLVQPVGKTKPEAARAWQSLLRWSARVSDLKEQSRLAMKGILTYGWGGMVDGWDSREQTKRSEKYGKDTTGKVVRNPNAATEIISCPTVEAINLRNAVFDPTCPSQNPNKGRWWASRTTVTAYDLQAMREDATYDDAQGQSKIPSDEQLRVLLANKQEVTKNSMIATQPNQTREYQKQDDLYPMSKDPLQQPLELIQYNTRDRIVSVLQRSIVIRNEKKKERRLGCYGCAFIDVLNSMFGWGVGRLLGGEQRFQQGVLNTWVDALSLLLNPAFQQIKGMGAGSQNISIGPGKVITTEGELKPLVVPDVSEAALNAIESSEQRSARRIGTEGGSNMPTQAMRTGTAAQAFQVTDVEAAQYFLEIYTDLVLIPVLKAQIEHICENLQPEQIQQILSDEDGKGYEGNILDVYNADLKLEIISASKLSVRQAAAQLAPLIVSLVSNSAVQQGMQISGTKFNIAEFAKEVLELNGWDINILFGPMSAADEQRMQQLNQAMSRAMGQIQLEQVKHQNEVDSIDAKGAQQAGLAVVKGVVKEHLDQGMARVNGNG